MRSIPCGIATLQTLRGKLYPYKHIQINDYVVLAPDTPTHFPSSPTISKFQRIVQNAQLITNQPTNNSQEIDAAIFQFTLTIKTTIESNVVPANNQTKKRGLPPEIIVKYEKRIACATSGKETEIRQQKEHLMLK